MTAATHLRTVGDLGALALFYNSCGLPVFPCKPGGKRPLTPHGYQDASADRATVEHWWTRWPDANIGSPTGVTFDVFDCDVKPHLDARPAMHELEAAGLLDGWAGRAQTRNGGYHFYYPASGAGGSSLPGFDFKARGGYILLPGSHVPADPGTPGDGSYRWLDVWPIPGGKPLDFEQVREHLYPAAPVADLWDRDRRRRPSRGSGRNLVAWLERQQEGTRNQSLFWALCRAHEDHLDLEDDLIDVARVLGLDSREIAATVASARRRCGR